MINIILMILKVISFLVISLSNDYMKKDILYWYYLYIINTWIYELYYNRYWFIMLLIKIIIPLT